MKKKVVLAHGFWGSSFDEAMTYIWQYLHQIEVVQNIKRSES